MRVTADDLAPFVEMAMGSIHREYPYHLLVVMRADSDARPPRELTPADFDELRRQGALPPDAARR